MNIKKYFKVPSSELLSRSKKIIGVYKYINWYLTLFFIIFPIIISFYLFPDSVIINVPVQANSFFTIATSTYIFSKPSGDLLNIITRILNVNLSIGSYKLCLYNGSTGTKNRHSLTEKELNALNEYNVGIDIYPLRDNLDQKQKNDFVQLLNGFSSMNFQTATKTFSRAQLVGLVPIVARAGQTSCELISFDQNGYIFSIPTYVVLGGPLYSENGPSYSEYDGIIANLVFNGGTNKYTVSIASTSVFMTTDRQTVWINRILFIIGWVTFMLIITQVFGHVRKRPVKNY